ncbi:MAG: Gx transporter family protein [Erysipelothrix sp.]|nr:Gx transporter family protein [Erysipelothrix sp.]
MKLKSATHRMSVLTMLVGMALIVNMIEPVFPIVVPGVKFGLANVLGLFAFYFFGAKELFIVNLMRVVIASLLRGTLLGTGFWLALSGTLLSSTCIVLFARFTNMSEIGLSSVSATFHNIGQIIVIATITSTGLIVTYLPIMLFMGVPTGIVTGYLVQSINKRLLR